ncbi:MAG TPA: hypothetical protein VKB19_10280 [Pedobacter sp.]|nr:hypothetical protein [Pedobacter sp.]
MKDIVGIGGIFTGLSSGTLDSQIYEFSFDIIDKYSKTVFQKKPKYEGGFFNRKYCGFDIVVNCNDDYVVITNSKGYCIRTGVPIPFNAIRPYCDEAYKSWANYSNSDYKEKYCHFSGESSNGATSLNKPILKKNWAASQGRKTS